MPETMKPTTARLRCTAGSGMFDHEAGVLIQGVDRWYESMIDRDLVSIAEPAASDQEAQAAWVDVNVIQANGTKLLVELPRQVVSGGRRIWVPRSEVKP